MRRVLVVTASEERAEEISSALERDHMVTRCPGPTSPTYVCIGGRNGHCPLVAAAELVVLDARLASDVAGHGTSSGELLQLYARAGLPVLTLVDPDCAPSSLPAGDLVALHHDSNARAVRDAVDWLEAEPLD